MNKNFSAMILAAGFGERMKPLTNFIPKPLIQVGNVTLLQNSIDFLFNIHCKKIVINTHYKHELISEFISKNYQSSKVQISYEKDILDTGGGVKNAISLFDDEDILVTNSDIFWNSENIADIKNLINDYQSDNECRILLVEKDKANGISNKSGDFSLNYEKVKRWTPQDKILYYSGLQILSLKTLNNINLTKFSFNNIWDFQIKKNSLYGNIMNSNWYHVGDIKGLNTAINSNA